jgi:uncharacterized protein (TIGR02284 family)
MKDDPTTQPDRDDVVSTLNGLIETCKDGANGFRTAADGVEDASLKRLFSSYVEQRTQFAAELERLVTGLGGNPADTGHIAGAVHRGWINLKSAVTGKDDGAVISECERGEDFAKERYRKALERSLPVDVRATVERQYMQVQEAHDHVRSLERSYSKK